MKYRIARKDKLGYFWNAREHGWRTQMSGDYTTYTTHNKAMLAAQRPARVYGPIHIEEDTHPRCGNSLVVSLLD